MLSVVVCNHDSGTQKTETRELLEVQGQPGIHSETLSQKSKPNHLAKIQWSKFKNKNYKPLEL